MNISAYWKATLSQQSQKMKEFFHKDAYVNWHNTNEHFTADEFIKINCEYPGKWNGNIERTEIINDLISVSFLNMNEKIKMKYFLKCRLLKKQEKF